ncbi:Acyl-CoA dehydrogenase middle domain-containing protein [Venturia nashicola]|uniref:Acyl-CoA dehydrogenase middle domain-containing protein n=1 Tax=Venturia nashicola TaxID=86259 RepID=A0A4Z1P0V2_9PEZI|nr:Acyl-CoA dehydrogenase middle domain-containing protein [Venturia nashicola]
MLTSLDVYGVDYVANALHSTCPTELIHFVIDRYLTYLPNPLCQRLTTSLSLQISSIAAEAEPHVPLFEDIPLSDILESSGSIKECDGQAITAWISGQGITARSCGSDVRGLETVTTWLPSTSSNRRRRFSSATDANTAVLLAKTEPDDKVPAWKETVALDKKLVLGHDGILAG